MWVRKEVELKDYSAFAIIIEGVIGDGANGDIAIDDITFTPGCQFFFRFV